MDVYQKAMLAFGVNQSQLERFKRATPKELGDASEAAIARYTSAVQFLDDLDVVMKGAPAPVRKFIQSVSRFDETVIVYVERWAKKIRDGKSAHGGVSGSRAVLKNGALPCNRSSGGRIMMRDIVQMVARATGVPDAEIVGQSKKLRVVMARQVAIYLAYMLEGTSNSTLKVGRYFGRDHSTIIYTLKKVEKNQHLMNIAHRIARENGLELKESDAEAV